MGFKRAYLNALIVLVSFSGIVGCSDDDDTDYGNWVESSSFDGDAR